MLARLASLLALVAAPAAAAEEAEVRLLHGWREPGRHVAALEITLPPGYHTYWRVPGSAGIAPVFDWSASGNLRSARIEWPRPDVFESFDIRTIGYHDRVVLPLLLTPSRLGAPIEVDLEVFFGFCKEICIPAEVRVAGRLEADAAPSGRPAIEQALADRIRSASEAGVRDARCRIAPGGEGAELAVSVEFATAQDEPETAVLELPRPEIWIGDAQASGATLTAEVPLGGAGAVDRSALRLTLIDAARAVEIEGCRAPD